MEIRNLIDTDYPSIYALCVKNNYLSELFSSYDMFSKFNECNKNTNFVMLENNTVIGALIASYDGYKCTIYHILVDNEFRRLGYGSKLLQSLNSFCSNHKCSSITVATYSSNESFRKFMKFNSYFTREDITHYTKTIF